MGSEGSVYPRRNKAGETIGWVADVQWGRGKTAQRVRRLRPTEDAARAVAQELVRARDGGYRADVFGLTVLDLFERYVGAKANAAPGVKPWASSSVPGRASLIKVHILPYLETRLLSELAAHDLNYVIERARVDDDGNELKAVPMQVYQLLTQALTWAHREKLIVSITFLVDVPRPSYKPTRRREFTGDELARIIDVVRPRPDAALWMLMLERGLRISEVAALLRPNIDRAGRLIRLTHGLERTDRAPLLVPRLKSERAYRDVPVSPLHLELLDRQLARLPELRETAGANWRERGLVFPDAVGDPLRHNTLHFWWRGILDAAGVAYAPPHVCRHTATSRMLRHIPLTEVAAIVGDKPETLLKVYAHAQIETARPALERLDARGG